MSKASRKRSDGQTRPQHAQKLNAAQRATKKPTLAIKSRVAKSSKARIEQMREALDLEAQSVYSVSLPAYFLFAISFYATIDINMSYIAGA